MKKTITIQNLKPLSINSTYYGTGNGFVKTDKARKWMQEVFFQLDFPENKEALAEITEAFNDRQHSLAVELVAEYPFEEMFTKKGTVSAKTQDITNWEKALVDCVFLPKHYGKPVPEGCDNLNIDDKFITKMTSEKRASTDNQYRLIVSIELLNLNIVNDED